MIGPLMGMIGRGVGMGMALPNLPHPNPGVISPSQNNDALLNALSGSPGVNTDIPFTPPPKKEPSKIGSLVIAHFARQKFNPKGTDTTSQQTMPPQLGQGSPTGY